MVIVAGAQPFKCRKVVSHDHGAHLLSNRNLPRIVFPKTVRSPALAQRDLVSVGTMNALPRKAREICPDDFRIVRTFKHFGHSYRTDPEMSQRVSSQPT